MSEGDRTDICAEDGFPYVSFLANLGNLLPRIARMSPEESVHEVNKLLKMMGSKYRYRYHPKDKDVWLDKITGDLFDEYDYE